MTSIELKTKLQKDINVYLSHAAPLCVILTDSRLYPWFYEHYVQIFSTTYEHSDGSRHFMLDFLEREEVYKEVLIEIPLEFELMREQNDIIHFIRRHIDLGYHQIIRVDDYYLPKGRSYHKYHIIHESLIYGYDDNRRDILTINFDDKGTFSRLRISYENFAAAYWKGIDLIQLNRNLMPAPHHGIAKLIKLREFNGDYPFDIRKFTSSLSDYIFSIGDSSRNYLANSYWTADLHSWQPHDVSGLFKFGFDIFEDFEQFLRNIVAGTEVADYRYIHLLYEQKRSIYSRLEYISSAYHVRVDFSDSINEYQEIVRNFEVARLKFLKYLTCREEAIISQIVEIVCHTKKEELMLLVRIYKQLQVDILGLRSGLPISL